MIHIKKKKKSKILLIKSPFVVVLISGQFGLLVHYPIIL